MAWEPVEGNPFAEDTAPASAAPTDESGMLSRFARGARNFVTGEDRTQYPDRPEFFSAYSQSKGPSGELPELGAKDRSAITPDPEAQFDILAKSIPGLQKTTDKFGNMMLKAPGMKDWTYLNKPGISGRDLDEFGTQTLATAPLLGWAGKAGTTLGMIGRGIAGMGASSVAQDAAAVAQGSEQGIDEGRAATSAALGGAVPAVLPIAKGIVGGIAQGGSRVKDAYTWSTNPREFARREVQGAFAEDAASGGVKNLSQAERQTAAGRGQDLRAMDYGGGTVQDLGRKAANQSGAARDTIMRVVTPRWKQQSGRASSLFQNEMGFDKSVKEVGEDLVKKARQARQPLYDQSYRAGADGISSAALDQLATSPLFARAMQRAQATIKDRAAIPGTFTTGMRGKNGYTLEYWDQVKQRLDDMHSAAKRTGANAKALDVDRLRRALRNELDTAVPLYSRARSTAEAYFDAGDALEAGSKFATGKFDLRDAAAAINQLDPAEKKLFNEGFARTFSNEVRATRDHTNVLNRINSSELERERMMLGLGSANYSQLEAFLRIEGIMDAMRGAMGNSTTVRQMVQQFGRQYGVQLLGGMVGSGGYAANDPHAMMVGAIMAGGRIGQQHINAKVAEHVADLLISKDPDIFLNGLKQAAKPGLMEALRAIDNAISSAGIYRAIGQQEAVNASQKADKQTDTQRAAFDKARAAIERGADRTAVMKRLQDSGINPRGL